MTFVQSYQCAMFPESTAIKNVWICFKRHKIEQNAEGKKSFEKLWFSFICIAIAFKTKAKT